MVKTKKPKKRLSFIREKDIKLITKKDNNYDITEFYEHTWMYSKGKPYKYEFKGDYAAVHDPDQLKIVRKKSVKIPLNRITMFNH